MTRPACPKILIVRGPPASGKTSVSLLLRDKLSPAARISVDVLRYLVVPRDFSFELLRSIKLNAARMAVSYAEQGISSIIESAFASREILGEMCSIIHSYGFTPDIFTLIADEKTIFTQNFQRDLFDQTNQARLEALYREYDWDIGQRVFTQGKIIEEVAADIWMRLENRPVPSQVENSSRYVLFLRHGQAPNHPNIFLSDDAKALSPLGQTQAMNIAPVVRSFNPDRVFCSPFLRTVQTARFACRHLDREIELRTGLTERTFPSLYGKSREEISAFLSPDISEKLNGHTDEVDIPGNETVQQAGLRVAEEMRQIIEQGAKKTLVVSHGGPHSWLCCQYLGIPLIDSRRFTLNEGHVSLFQLDASGSFQKIIYLNANRLGIV